jgi:hypothetical protein
VGEDGMTTIAPNDPNILYSPYTWLVTAQMAKTINAGAYLRVAFTGTPGTLTATFDVSAGNYSPRVAIRYDGGPWQETQVAGSSVPIALTQTIPADANLFNTWGTHVVEIMMIASSEGVDRWASQLNALKFTGLVADVAVATKPVRARPLYGFLIGDSIAEGVRALNVTATGDQRRNDNRLAWTGPLRELLGAEIGVAGFGGVGVAGSGSGGVPLRRRPHRYQRRVEDGRGGDGWRHRADELPHREHAQEDRDPGSAWLVADQGCCDPGGHRGVVEPGPSSVRRHDWVVERSRFC